MKSSDEAPLVLIQGRYLGFVTTPECLQDKHRCKHIRLISAHGEQLIKIPKALRIPFQQEVELGSEVRLWGYLKQGRFKAVMAVPLAPRGFISLVPSEMAAAAKPCYTEQAVDPTIEYIEPAQAKPKTIKIQVCQKGSCRKRGSHAVAQALKASVAETPGANIEVESVGCLGACKQGPNLRVLPSKQHYQRVDCAQVPVIVENLSSPALHPA
jgi:(2Fe-2S) ferredoxin